MTTSASQLRELYFAFARVDTRPSKTISNCITNSYFIFGVVDCEHNKTHKLCTVHFTLHTFATRHFS